MEVAVNLAPMLSIITVSFNSAKTIRHTIESVLNQTFGDFEYIIIDGCSQDNTLKIIQEYTPVFFAKGINYRWISEPDNGIYDAMNKGINLATGEWINFMNSGDLFFNSNVLLAISPMLEGDLVYGDHAIYRDNVENYKLVHVGNYKDKRNIPFCHQALFLKKKFADKFPFDLQFKIAADYDQYLKCKHSAAVIKYIPVHIVRFLDGGLSAVSRRELIYEYFIINKNYNKFGALAIYMIRLIKNYLFNK